MTLIFVILTFIVVILTLILLLLITVLESDESLEIFAPYVGQVLDLRYHAKKGTRVAGQHEGRPDFRTFSNCCRKLEFPFHNWEILMPDKSYVPLNIVIDKTAPKCGADHYESLVPIDNIPDFFRLYHVYNHWDAGINFINSKLTEHRNLYKKKGPAKGRK